MRLEKIFLKDFGCFQSSQDFELTEGINLIFGPNFSGKSTLVNTIFFTLTGKPILPRVNTSAMRHANAYSGTAGLQFACNGYQYQLFRATGTRIQLRSRKQQADASRWQILFDEKRVKVVETELANRFGFAHQHLALTTFLREGEIFEFLAQQPTTRRDILYALLGIDKLIDVRESFIDARRLAKREENRIRAHQSSLRFKAQNIHADEIQKIEEELKNLESEYDAQTDDTELIAEWTQRKAELKTKLGCSAGEQVDALKGFNDINHLNQKINQIQQALTESSELNTKREALIQEIGSSKSHILTLTTVCDTLRALLEDGNRHCPTCYQAVTPEVVQRIIDEKNIRKIQTASSTIETRAILSQTEQ